VTPLRGQMKPAGVGWVQAGIEWAFTPSWSIKLEYNYRDFGREQLTSPWLAAERRHSLDVFF
jgi:opacity protein-like surface antigen